MSRTCETTDDVYHMSPRADDHIYILYVCCRRLPIDVYHVIRIMRATDICVVYNYGFPLRDVSMST